MVVFGDNQQVQQPNYDKLPFHLRPFSNKYPDHDF